MPDKALLGVAAFALAGCSIGSGISSSYPDRWPPLSTVRGKDCSHLAGHYRDFGVYSYLPAKDASDLTQRLAASEIAPGSTPSPESVISVEGVATDGSSFRRAFRIGGTGRECKDGVLLLSPIVVSVSDAGAAGYRSQRRLALYKAGNGDLIGEDSLFSIGHLLIVPMAGSQTYWYRWELLGK
ncbi:hypothetical protein DSM104443_00290 [Usitatibacter rugosus]|uniref:Lipoprotein n=1 Tax=Usitatibacter rugosus TaxID=2732067 RepID=A0A6M4GSH5_9PROT|nr:hypothetical protein [Usitatibacter rugosus]QJR09253.1 hypothetical protein DSM104443_00290 [Usitatibacter rugosus]